MKTFFPALIYLFFICYSTFSQNDSCYSSHPVMRFEIPFGGFIFGNANSYPRDYREAGNLVFFTAEYSLFGRELWRTDGTEEGTFLVKDIVQGSGASFIEMGIGYKNKLYFTASDGFTNSLWESDGTEIGTKKISTIITYFTKMYVTNTKLFIFTPSDLYVYDGINPISSIKTIYGGKEAIEYNDVLYFTAEDSGNGELWKSDGTTNGTVRVKDIHPTYYSYPTQFTLFQNKIFFLADDGSHGSNRFYELWQTDGTETGTVKINGTPNSSFLEFNAIHGATNDKMFLTATMRNTYQRSLWKSDGSTLGTVKVKDIETMLNSSVVNNTLVFSSDYAVNGVRRYRLWKSDGTDQGTNPIQDIIVNNILRKSKNNNDLFFVRYKESSSIFQYDLWKTNGTPEGTVQVKDVYVNNGLANTQISAYLNNKVIFSAADSTHGVEPWLTDGTEQGTSLIRDCYKLPIVRINEQVVGGNNFLFIKNKSDDYYGKANYQIWRSNGDMSDMVLLKSSTEYTKVPQYPTYEAPVILGTVNDKVLFSIDTPQVGIELWVSDGTPQNTNVLVNTGFGSSLFSYLHKFNNNIFFRTQDPSNYQNTILWVTDGTNSGTKQLINRIGYPSDAISHQNLTFFNFGNVLLRTDGTVNGTYSLLTMPINNLKIIENTQQWNMPNLYFYLNRADSVQIWKYSLNQNSFSKELQIKMSNFGEISVAGQRIYIVGANKIVSVNNAFTSVVEVINSNDKFIPYRVIGNNYYFFKANDTPYATNTQLWKSDGTIQGTIFLKTIPWRYVVSGTRGNVPSINGKYFFVTDGHLLWETDGTAENTRSLNSFTDTESSIYLDNRVSTIFKNKFYFLRQGDIYALGWFQNLNQSLKQYISKDIFSSSVINSQNRLFQYSNADYNASKYIDLLPGFDVESRGNFKAQIIGCPNN